MSSIGNKLLIIQPIAQIEKSIDLIHRLLPINILYAGSKTGYVHNWHLYVGKDENGTSLEGLGYRVVMNICPTRSSHIYG